MYRYYVLFVLIFGVSHGAPLGNKRAGTFQCPPGFSLHIDTCFKVVRIKASWAEGQTYCQAMNGRLAIIDTQIKNTFVVNMIKKVVKPGTPADEQFWLGSTDIQKEGLWLWMDTGVKITFSHWKRGEPNNFNEGADTDNCLEIWYKDNYLWNDRNCEVRQSIVCETSPLENFGVIG